VHATIGVEVTAGTKHVVGGGPSTECRPADQALTAMHPLAPRRRTVPFVEPFGSVWLRYGCMHGACMVAWCPCACAAPASFFAAAVAAAASNAAPLEVVLLPWRTGSEQVLLLPVMACAAAPAPLLLPPPLCCWAPACAAVALPVGRFRAGISCLLID
jgi:hypothetical protein